MAEEPAIVIDNGSGTIKAGLAGDNAPSSIFPSVVGSPKDSGDGLDVCVGGDAVDKRGFMELQYPIERGVVNNWDVLERLWQYTFESALQKDASEHFVLFTDPPLNVMGNRERMVTTAFENFSVQGTYIANSAVMALYASGRTTGLVLESGYGITHTVPIFEGFATNKTVGTLDLGGADLTNNLMNGLIQEGVSLPADSEIETAQQIKEELCYISSNLESENGNDGQYTLPDGQIISVGTARYQVPEALFNPSVGQGIHNLVFNSTTSSDVDAQTQLFGNVVLAGGSTLLDGFASRLNTELSNLSPASTKIEVAAPADRKYSTWIGGSIQAQHSTFEKTAITATEYNEVGPSIVYRKCF